MSNTGSRLPKSCTPQPGYKGEPSVARQIGTLSEGQLPNTDVHGGLAICLCSALNSDTDDPGCF